MLEINFQAGDFLKIEIDKILNFSFVVEADEYSGLIPKLLGCMRIGFVKHNIMTGDIFC